LASWDYSVVLVVVVVVGTGRCGRRASLASFPARPSSERVAEAGRVHGEQRGFEQTEG